MQMMQTLLIFLICLAASAVGGVCGIGGGVVIKPVLDVTGLMSIPTGSFLSGLTVLAMAVISLFKNRKSNQLEGACSIPLGIGAAVGGVCGKQLFELIRRASGQERIVGMAQAILLGLMILGTLLYVLNKSCIRTHHVTNKVASIGIGFALGLCSSFLGIGGGPMNLAVLYFFYSMDTKKAVVNSILIIMLSQTASLIAALVTGDIPAFAWITLPALVLAGATGGAVAAKLQRKLSASQTDKLLIALLILILGICVLNAIGR